ncbi:MAG: hypothetical protein R2726_02005 [Acidimicrobiales bacterium]
MPEPRLIELRLHTASELFELPTADLFSEYRNWLTGVEQAISELKAYSLRARDVVLRISLPRDEITPGLDDQVAKSLRRYCANRRRYNHNEVRALRHDGFNALFLGLLLLALGLLGSEVFSRDTDNELVQTFLGNGIFIVLAWVGLWYPLDTLVFAARPYQRESKALDRLAGASIELVPR